MKKALILAAFALFFLACGDSSTSNNNGSPQGLTVNQDQLVSGNLAGESFVFVSGSYKKEGDVLHITLYPAEPLPEADRLWSPWDNNLNVIMLPIFAKVGTYLIPYQLDPAIDIISSPTLFQASSQRNIATDFGVVEIYSIDEASGVVKGGVHISDPQNGTELNGTFTVHELSTF